MKIHGGQVRMQAGNLEESLLPKEAADVLKERMKENGGQIRM